MIAPPRSLPGEEHRWVEVLRTEGVGWVFGGHAGIQAGLVHYVLLASLAENPTRFRLLRGPFGGRFVALLAVRTAGAPEAMAAAVGRKVRAMNPEIAI
jgi:hypothetical protein